MRIPAGILKHWSNTYALDEEPSNDPRYRIFRFDEKNIRPIQPRTTGHVSTFDYCIPCAITDTGEREPWGGAIVADREVELTIWIDGRNYQTVKTLKELSRESEANS